MIGLGLGVHNIPMKSAGSAGFDISTIPGLQIWAKNQEGVSFGTNSITWTDSSGNGNNLTQTVGTVVNGMSYDSSTGAFDMAGATSSLPRYFDFPNQELSTLTAFFVVKMNLTSGFDYYGLAQDRNDSANSYMQMFASSSQAFCYLYGQNAVGNRTGATTATNIPVDQQYYVHVIHKDAASGATVTFYNNTDVMATTSAFSNNFGVSLNTLGYGAVGDRGLNGEIREFALYDTALTFEEVEQVVNDLKSRNGIS